MPVGIDQWPAAIGLFGAHRYVAIIKKRILKYSNLKALTILLFFYYSTIICLLLVQHGDIEINPGPRKKQPKYFLCCHSNVSSLLAHNKISLLTAYDAIHQHDVICLSETFFDFLVCMLIIILPFKVTV